MILLNCQSALITSQKGSPVQKEWQWRWIHYGVDFSELACALSPSPSPSHQMGCENLSSNWTGDPSLPFLVASCRNSERPLLLFLMREERLFKKRKQNNVYIWKLTILLLFFFFLALLIFLKLWGFFFPLVSESILAVIFLQIREFRGIKKRKENSKHQANQTEKEQYKEQNDSIRIYIPIFDEILE